MSNESPPDPNVWRGPNVAAPVLLQTRSSPGWLLPLACLALVALLAVNFALVYVVATRAQPAAGAVETPKVTAATKAYMRAVSGAFESTRGEVLMGKATKDNFDQRFAFYMAGVSKDLFDSFNSSSNLADALAQARDASKVP